MGLPSPRVCIVCGASKYFVSNEATPKIASFGIHDGGAGWLLNFTWIARFSLGTFFFSIRKMKESKALCPDIFLQSNKNSGPHWKNVIFLLIHRPSSFSLRAQASNGDSSIHSEKRISSTRKNDGNRMNANRFAWNNTHRKKGHLELPSGRKCFCV